MCIVVDSKATKKMELANEVCKLCMCVLEFSSSPVCTNKYLTVLFASKVYVLTVSEISCSCLDISIHKLVINISYSLISVVQ